MKEKRKSIWAVVLSSAIILLFSSYLGARETISTYRGNIVTRNKATVFMMSPNETRIYYYNTDGRDATFKWKTPSKTWLFNSDPAVTMQIYFTWGNNRPWYHMRGASIDPFTQKFKLPLNEGRYKFHIKAYSQSIFSGARDPQAATVELWVE